jgi:glycine/D-amino acid oxidase-like deaminating enzyme
MRTAVTESKGHDVVVVGAGIIGSALAYHLSRAGATVAIVDRAQPATGTTASSFAYVNAAAKRPYPYFRLNAAGMVEHAALRAELGEAPWRVTGGRLLWHRDTSEMASIEALVSESAGWEYRAEWLDTGAAAALEPDLRFDGAERIAYFPEETAVDAPSLAKKLLDLAVAGGAKSVLGQAVIGLCRRGERITGVTLANGEQINASFVINCAGPEADHVAQLAGRRLPLGQEIGLITYATLHRAAVHRILDASGALIRPVATGSSQLIVQDGAADASIVRGEPAVTVAERTLESIRLLLPADATLTLDRITVGMRPIPIDGVTSAGLSTVIPGYGEIVTHSGVTLGPLLGRLIAREIAGDAPDPLLADFRPERFI